MSLFDWLRSKQKETDSKNDRQRATTVNNAISRLSNVSDESRVGVVILLACMVFSSCNQAQKPMTGSFSMRLVHKQSALIVNGVLPSNQVDLAGYSLLPAHPAAASEDLPKQYWVSESELISHTDLASAKLVMPKIEVKPLTRENYDALIKQGTGNQILLGKTYEQHLSKYRTYPEIELTFSSSGQSKFASVTRQNYNRHLAIVVDGQVLMAPLIQEEVHGSALIRGSFSKEEVGEIIRKIYGE